jgi:hypothetical protein
MALGRRAKDTKGSEIIPNRILNFVLFAFFVVSVCFGFRCGFAR